MGLTTLGLLGAAFYSGCKYYKHFRGKNRSNNNQKPSRTRSFFREIKGKAFDYLSRQAANDKPWAEKVIKAYRVPFKLDKKIDETLEEITKGEKKEVQK